MDTKEFINKTATLLKEINLSYRIVDFTFGPDKEHRRMCGILVRHIGFRFDENGHTSYYCDEVTAREAIAFMFKEFGLMVFQDDNDIVFLGKAKNLHQLYASKKKSCLVAFGDSPFPWLISPPEESQRDCLVVAAYYAHSYFWKNGELFHIKNVWTGELEKANEFIKTRNEVILAGKKRMEKLGIVGHLWGAP